jgi:23S rRNA pseudouridine2605 synthase
VVDEGRPHLIKRLCEAVGFPVQRLYRPDYAGISAEGMEPGTWRELSQLEIKLLKAGGAKNSRRELGMPARRHGRGPGGSAASLGVRGRRPKRFNRKR